MEARPIRKTRPQHRPAYKKFYSLLKQLREDAGYTQRELAAHLKEVPSYVAKSETGARRMGPVEFVAWCKACDATVAKHITKL